MSEIADGQFEGEAGPLDYRLYRPDTPGPHPITVYFHCGGWVLGDHAADDALCRDLCNQSGSIIVSGNYRHASGARFPATADDGFSAITWAAKNANAARSEIAAAIKASFARLEPA